MQAITNHMYIHAMFCTKNCAYLILPENEEKLWNCISTHGAQNSCPISAIGGTCDHLHMVFTPSPSRSVDSIIKDIKKYSKSWMNNSFFGEKRPFDWQDGYGAFSTSRSKLKTMARYIDDQKKIHETMTYEEELIKILNFHEVEFEKSELLD